MIKFQVNGESYEILVEPNRTLLEVLREDLGLTGTKYGCGKGECGACTVLVDGKAILSCLTLAVTAKDSDILTIEGLQKNGDLHPIQEAFIEYDAVDCGYCFPGRILATKALLEENPNPTKEEVKEYLKGNLCRYRKECAKNRCSTKSDWKDKIFRRYLFSAHAVWQASKESLSPRKNNKD
jgi:carbon-monoxide dehydrogenase small subunit